MATNPLSQIVAGNPLDLMSSTTSPIVPPTSQTANMTLPVLPTINVSGATPKTEPVITGGTATQGYNKINEAAKNTQTVIEQNKTVKDMQAAQLAQAQAGVTAEQKQGLISQAGEIQKGIAELQKQQAGTTYKVMPNPDGTFQVVETTNGQTFYVNDPAVIEKAKNALTQTPTGQYNTAPITLDASGNRVTTPVDAQIESFIRSGNFDPTEITNKINNLGGSTTSDYVENYMAMNSYPLSQTYKLNQQITANQAEIDATNTSYQDAVAKILNGTYPLTSAQQASITAMQAQFEELRREQTTANQNLANTVSLAGAAAGRNRYSPETQAGYLQSAISAGITKIADLDNKASQALAELQQGFMDNDLKMIDKAYEAQKNALAEKDKHITELYDRTRAAVKEQRDYNKEQETEYYNRVTKPIEDIAKEAAKGGASKEIIDAISQSKNVQEALNTAGNYLQVGTGIVAEYKFYEQDALTRGLPVMSFDEYQTRDANRKIQIANINAGGLTTQENQTYLSITNKYQADAIINSAIKAEQVKLLADQIIRNPEKATNQLASLYIYVKNLDPDSAVREGELSLANTTQSFFQKFGNNLDRIKEGRVLSPNAAKELAEATKTLVNSWQITANKKTKLYQSQAKNSSPNVGGAFDKYLNDYNASVISGSNTSIEEAKQRLIDYAKENSSLQIEINDYGSKVNPETGTEYQPDEIEQILKAKGLIQ